MYRIFSERGWKMEVLMIESIIDSADAICRKEGSSSESIGDICELLRSRIPYYNWVGVYLVGLSGNELILGPYSGDPTEHIRIPFGRGVCGQSAALKKPLIVGDVTREKHYLSCSIRVKSEIVVPILRNDSLLGVLDIDSHVINAFGDEDLSFLRRIASIVSALL